MDKRPAVPPGVLEVFAHAPRAGREAQQGPAAVLQLPSSPPPPPPSLGSVAAWLRVAWQRMATERRADSAVTRRGAGSLRRARARGTVAAPAITTRRRTPKRPEGGIHESDSQQVGQAHQITSVCAHVFACVCLRASGVERENTRQRAQKDARLGKRSSAEQRALRLEQWWLMT